VKPFWPVIASFLVILSISFGFYAEFHKARESVARYLNVWEDEMSHSSMANNMELSEKILGQLPNMSENIKVLSARINERQVKEASGSACYWREKFPVSFNSLPVGLIETCVEPYRIFTAAVRSPISLIALAILFSSWFFYYRREMSFRFEIEMNRKLTELAKQVAHDIRSPVMALRTLAEAGQEFSTDKQVLLKNTADRIQRIAEDILFQSKIPTKAKLDGCQPHAAIAEIVGEMKVRFPRQDFLFEDAQAIKTLVLPLDKTVFQRIISNLLQNAVDASQPNNSAILVQLSVRGSQSIILVTDRGSGITEENLAKVGQGNFSTKQEGSGLGISYVRDQLNKVGGSFTLLSKPGIGTQVQLRIPFIP
jgi:signal transduction histidine kinase